MRTLSEVAVRQPVSVAKCNDDMEGLVSDSNRSVATLAITTLLKTGSESSIDRLMKQVSSFMNDIGDEYKIVIVKAIRELCVKYPPKHRVMLGFLATFLREEGGYEFKKSIVDSIVGMMSAIPETKEPSLLHLCEFIEDCEFSELIIQILYLVGSTGPSTTSPSRYIRFVFNRVILECAAVRAAAVATLGAFAARVPELRPSIVTLLRRSLVDEDDEVRDRAALLLQSFDTFKDDDNDLRFLFDEPIPMTFTALERSIKSYIAHPSNLSGADNNKPITFPSLPIIEDAYVPVLPTAARGASKRKTTPSAGGSGSGNDAAASVPQEVIDPAFVVYKIPELTSIGRAFRTCAEVALTETEMEYVVTCTKHIFESHVVLQFSVLNTIDDQRLKNAYVNVEISEPDSYSIHKVFPAPIVRYGEASNCFVSLARSGDPAPMTLSCELHFKVVQVDPTTGEVEGDEEGYDEEYPLEPIEISTNDFMAKVSVSDFRRSWEQAGTDGEVLEKFALQFKKLDDAVNAVIDFLGMQPADGTGIIPSTDGPKRTHTLHLSGVFVGNVPVLVRAQIQIDDASSGTVLKMAVRSPSKEISTLVAECIH